MPILEVEFLKRVSSDEPDKATVQKLADAAGKIFGTGPGRTWVKMKPLSIEHYAENDCQLPDDARPIMVTILKSKTPDGEELEREVTRLTEAFAEILDRPTENIHLKYEPEGAGRVAFGGKLVE